MEILIAQAGGPLRGTLRVPGDKSISHRAVMLGSVAEGLTTVEGYLPGTDVLATIGAFRALGVPIEEDAGMLRIHGAGLRGLKQPAIDLDLGNSGTATRLLCGILAGAGIEARLVGDASLSGRPMNRVATPLTAMGAVLHCAARGTLPMRIEAGHPLRGISYPLPIASAQVKSCILLAGLYADGETRVFEPAPSRDHTERMLRNFGYPVHTENGWVSLRGGGQLQGRHIQVPADLSSAAFFMVAASIVPDSDLTLLQVGINPTRTGIIDILRLMNARIELHNQHNLGGEPVADIRVRASALRGIAIDESLVPLAIDEFPVIAVAAACAEGQTTISGAAELRVKESDRIADTAAGLARLGIRVETREGGMIISGGEMQGGTVDSVGDHRLAMSFAVAGLRAGQPVRVLDCANVATSFPGFVTDMNAIGATIAVAAS